MIYSQQGDCLLFNEPFTKKGAKKIAGTLLHKGENHHHRISGKATIYEKDGVRFVVAEGTTKLVHEEHKPITLKKGSYRLAFVQEYDHFLEESRNVID
jgi:hypothetical protein